MFSSFDFSLSLYLSLSIFFSFSIISLLILYSSFKISIVLLLLLSIFLIILLLFKLSKLLVLFFELLLLSFILFFKKLSLLFESNSLLFSLFSINLTEALIMQAFTGIFCDIYLLNNILESWSFSSDLITNPSNLNLCPAFDTFSPKFTKYLISKFLFSFGDKMI